MKTRFEEFIELAIPDRRKRNALKIYISSCANGAYPQKRLILHGDGMSGKTMLVNLLYFIFGDDIHAWNIHTVNQLDKICGSKNTIVIPMVYSEKLAGNPTLLSELKEEKDSIRDWFLK